MANEIALRPRYSPERQVRRETITFRSAQIIFRNFTGKPGPYNEEGERSFAILLDEELAQDLANRGMNIKPLKRREEDDDQMYYLPVTVSYRRRGPRIYMVTGDGDTMPLRKTLLPEDMVEMMDNLELSEAHMVIAVSNYEVRGTKGKKAYLQSFFGHVLMDELEQEYATVEDMIHVDTKEHEVIDNIIDGEYTLH
jgi:hypothetical protein